MSTSRPFLAAPLLIALAAPAAREEPAFRVESGTTLVRTVKSSYALELDDVHFSMNGEEVEDEFFDSMEMRMKHEETHVVTDAFEAVAAGRPARLRRTYDELSGSDHNSFTHPEGTENDDAELESALEKLSVVFTWNEEAGRYDAAFPEDQHGDPELLEGLEEDMDLRAFLPGHAVSEGDSWTIEPSAFQAVIEPGGDVALADPEDEQDEDTDTADAALRDNLAGTIRATFTGVRSEGEVRVAVIELAVEIRTHSENEMGADELPEGGAGTDRAEPSFVLAGELRWDLEHGHALGLELSGENHLTLAQSMSGDFEGEHMEQEQTMVFSGEFSFSLAVERR